MSLRQSPLERALPIVAAAYGQQFGVKVVLSGTGAYTDGETIVLPMLSNMSDLKDVLFGYLAHEAAHVRDSNFSVITQCKSDTEKTILNIIEDIRIEKVIQDVFPGTKFTLDTMWDYVISQRLSPASNPEDNEATQLIQYLLHRLRSEYLLSESSTLLAEQSQLVVDETYPLGFFIRLDGLLGKYMNDLSCTSDCLSLARSILNAVEEAEEEERQQETSGDDSESTDDQSNTGESNDGHSSQSDSDPSSTDNGQSTEGADSTSPNSTQGKQSSMCERLENETELPEDVIKQLGNELETQATRDNHGDNVTIDTSCAGDDVFNSGETESLHAGILASSVIRSRLTGLLQAKSREKQWLHTKGKRVDAKRLTRLTAGDSRIFINREQKLMPNTAVHVLLDASGSMGDMQLVANQATISLSMAVSSIPKCDIAVSMFPGVNGSVSSIVHRNQPIRPNIGRFSVRPSGGTPLAEAMFHAARELSESKRQRKVIIVITDGCPNDPNSVNYINKMIDGHIDTYAIGINSTAVSRFFDKWTVISDVKELQNALFNIAGQFLELN